LTLSSSKYALSSASYSRFNANFTARKQIGILKSSWQFQASTKKGLNMDMKTADFLYSPLVETEESGCLLYLLGWN
jgi:hypothetical protein